MYNHPKFKMSENSQTYSIYFQWMAMCLVQVGMHEGDLHCDTWDTPGMFPLLHIACLSLVLVMPMLILSIWLSFCLRLRCVQWPNTLYWYLKHGWIKKKYSKCYHTLKMNLDFTTYFVTYRQDWKAHCFQFTKTCMCKYRTCTCTSTQNAGVHVHVEMH